MAIRIPWDKYEAALLLDYCIKVENKVLSRDEAVSIVSQRLRRRAIVAGLEIDDVFVCLIQMSPSRLLFSALHLI